MDIKTSVETKEDIKIIIVKANNTKISAIRIFISNILLCNTKLTI